MSYLLPKEFSFYIGALNLSPYRLVLIFGVPFAIAALVSRRSVRLHWVDYLLFGHLAWTGTLLTYHHGAMVGLEAGGIRIIELGGAYLFARGFIQGSKEFAGFVALVTTIVCSLAALTVVESITGYHAVRIWASTAAGLEFTSPIEPRFGLHRAYGPFDHPILYGVFASSAFGLAWFAVTAQVIRPKYARAQALSIVAATVASVSSGALASLALQILLIAWAKTTAGLRNPWILLSAIGLLFYFVIDVLSNRSPTTVLLHYLTFSAHTAYYRMAIFDYAIQDVWNNPVFGIGMNPWSKADWMASDSLDNFWLLQAVSFGLPGFLTLLAALIGALMRPPRKLAHPDRHLRIGWTISVLSLAIAGCTVHFWGSLFTYFGLLIGAGAWLGSSPKSGSRIPASRDEPSEVPEAEFRLL